MAENPSTPDPFQQSVTDWLARADPELLAFARYAAIPHSFDLDLLAALRGEKSDPSAWIVNLERANLLYELDTDASAETEATGWSLHPTARELLIQRWQQEDGEEYRLVNRMAAAYFEKNRRSLWDEAERLYHLLADDPEQGLHLLVVLFENAWADRRLGLADRLVTYAEEQVAVLTPEQQGWVRYLRARLERVHQRYQASESILRELSSDDTDPGVRGQALMELGELQLETQRWRDAFATYQDTQLFFHQQGDRFNGAGAWEALGLAYVNLASVLGGLQEGSTHFRSRWRAVRHHIQHAPFLLYRWFSRRVPFLPSLYYGTNYQDWFIIRTLYAAIQAFETALEELRLLPDDAPFPVARVRVDLTIRLADLRHRVDQWRETERKFRALAAEPLVADDIQLQASLDLVRGRAALAQGHLQQARDRLRRAQETLHSNQTLEGEVMAARLLGDVEMAAGDPSQAAQHYLACGQAAAAQGDLLTVTDVSSLLSLLESRHPLPPERQEAIADFAQSMDRRAYVARFPGGLRQRFRRQAAVVTAPITYLLITVLVFVLPFAFGAVEMLIRAASTYPGPLSDLLGGVAIFTGIPLVSWWLYELIYVAAGMRFVRSTPVEVISSFQPKYVVTLPEGILIRGEDGNSARYPWPTLARIVTIDRTVWRSPVSLFSRWVIRSIGGSGFVLEGVFRHYRSLQKEITARLAQSGQPIETVDLTFSFLRSRWTALALLLTLLFIPVSIFSWIDPTFPRPHWRYVSAKAGFHIHVIDGEGNLQLVDAWNPEGLQVLASMDLGGDARAVARRGVMAYVAAGPRGLLVVDMSQTDSPRIVAQLDTLGTAQDVVLTDGYAFVADGPGGLRIVDIARPDAPVEVGAVAVPGAHRLASGAGLVYVAGEGGLLSVVDVADPAAARVIGEWQAPERIAAMALAGERLVLAVGESGVVVLDVSAAPQEISRYDTAGHAQGVAVSTRFAFIADGDAGLLVLDIQPSPPELVQVLPTTSPAVSVAHLEAQGYVYVGLGPGGLRPVYLLNPEKAPESDAPLMSIDADILHVLPSYRLPFATLLYEFLYWARLFFPIVGLIRLLQNRAAVRRETGELLAWRGELSIGLALIFLFGLTAFHTYMLTL